MMETALVVDDDFLMRGYAVDRLKQEGVFAIEASSGKELSRLQASQKFDLVFADLDIFQAADGLFHRETDTVYVVMTSFRNVDKAIKLVSSGGVYDYLLKPFSPEQVSVIISRTRELLRLRTQVELLQKKVVPADRGPQTVAASEISTESEAITNLQDLERQTIMRVLHETRGSRSVMAERLGISVRTLRNKLTQYKQEASLQLP
ncbi:helix-turn-helix domain-containing protein [Pontiellaceae bacterium B12219]|nr:helix-turn-helix domain-containing protein [Pontiellaceae bacterium B12219]